MDNINRMKNVDTNVNCWSVLVALYDIQMSFLSCPQIQVRQSGAACFMQHILSWLLLVAMLQTGEQRQKDGRTICNMLRIKITIQNSETQRYKSKQPGPIGPVVNS